MPKFASHTPNFGGKAQYFIRSVLKKKLKTESNVRETENNSESLHKTTYFCSN